MRIERQITPTVVIPTGASLSRREREAEWRDPLFLKLAHAFS
jgi:hypothetical protein